MATEPKGGGRDPQYLLDLLWRTRPPGTRGPRGSLTLDQIVGAAVEIADAEGVEGVSMRKVAEKVGVTTMSLYRYVPSKDDLLDLMFEMGTGMPDTSDWPDDWYGRIESYALDVRRVMIARPWMIDIPISGPPMGPNNIAWMEAVLASLSDTPLSEDDKLGVLMVVSGFVLNEVSQEVSVTRAAPRTGVGYMEWGMAYQRMLEKVTDNPDYPALSRLVKSGAFADDRSTAEEDFLYGLRFILDGITALYALRGPGGREARAGNGT
ncbi:TetR/AcrR family transcriptional regulator [Streptomyces avicenniae]|uniref:TetR/AcrR family transcriptional regulator n=1 Tax=Streptomyces avicenniae TaxID=500153 RepID=UPI0006996F47|nr:TetR/AcrR family transcriptional regulator [Streptomyces avicenniae]